MMKRVNYRPEIDGLRAIAVLSVIIFHSGVQKLSGGFIGVDIFYVISGYLITNIIYSSLKKGEFSFSGFYVRRIKRLLPAYLFMVLCTLFFGVFILTPDKYVELSKSAIYANLFMANIWFMNHSGYFDLSTQTAPLVHMWSLSVEEQFYLLFPLILFYSHKINGLKGIKFSVFIILTISFVLSVLLSSKFPDFSFYMLITRAWELGIGASLAIFSVSKLNNKLLVNALSSLGILLIIYGLLNITHNDPYPGYMALFPTLGTALIIYSLNNNYNIVKSIITSKPLLFMGKISYSAYLWHWPLVVYYRVYVNEREFYFYEVCLLIVSSIFVGYLSWKYIEEQYRYKQYSSIRVYAASLSSIVVVIGISGGIYLTHGFPGRISEASLAIADSKLMWDWECTEEIRLIPEINESFCVIGAPWDGASIRGLVWGDSHSQHWAQLLHYEALRNGMSLVIAPRLCPPYLNSEYVKSHYPKFPRFTKSCTIRNNRTLKLLNNNDDISIVIMASAWSGHVRMLYTDNQLVNKSNLPLNKKDPDIGSALSKVAFHKLLSKLKDKKILLIADIPRPNKILNECAVSEMSGLLRKKCRASDYRFLSAKDILSWHRSSDRILTELSDEFSNVHLLIPSDGLCDKNHCKTYINGELIYKDSNHIRRNLNDLTVEVLSDIIELDKHIFSLIKY